MNRRRTALLLLLLLATTVLCVQRCRSPDVLTRLALAVAPRFGAELLELTVSSAGTRSIALGRTSFCSPLGNHRWCVALDGATVEVSPVLAVMPVAVRRIEARNAVVWIAPDAGSTGASNTGLPLTLPTLPMAVGPLPEISLIADPPLGSGFTPPEHATAWRLAGSFHPAATSLRVAVTLESAKGHTVTFEGESSNAHPFAVIVEAGSRSILEATVVDPGFESGAITLNTLAPVDAVLPELLPNLGELLDGSLTLRWKPGEGGTLFDIQGSLPKLTQLPGMLDMSQVQYTASLALVRQQTGALSGSLRSGAVRAIATGGASHTVDVSGIFTAATDAALQLQLAHRESGVITEATAGCRMPCSAGWARFISRPKTVPAELTRLPTAVRMPFVLRVGSAAAHGSLPWGAGSAPPTLDIELHAADLGSDLVTITGLDGTMHVLPAAAPPSALHARTATCGIVLDQPAASLKLDRQHGGTRLLVLQAQAAVLGGTVALEDGALGGPDSGGTVRFHGLGLGPLLELSQQSYVEADGTIGGELPFRIGADGLSIHEGKLYAEGPGSIRYLGSTGQEPESLSVAELALQNYQFSTLTAGIEYQPTGELLIDAHLTGTAPGMNTTRPVNVNLSLQENVLDLLRSLQIAQDVEREVGHLW